MEIYLFMFTITECRRIPSRNFRVSNINATLPTTMSTISLASANSISNLTRTSIFRQKLQSRNKCLKSQRVVICFRCHPNGIQKFC